MIRTFLAVSAVFLVAACGDGNPIAGGGGGGGPGGGGIGQPDTREGAVYGTALNGQLTMNNLVYDSVNDQVIVNNIPFDGPDGRYINTGTLPNGFGRYESQETAETGRRQYYAVFLRSASGFSQAAAVGSPEYVTFGFGGATAQRANNNVQLGGVGEYVYTGAYAAVRTFDESAPGAPGGEVQFITGDAVLEVDIYDFDINGAVEGLILNRMLYNQDGTPAGPLDDYISLATASIDFATGTINASSAFLINNLDSSILAQGQWSGVFAGPNGQEIAGILVLEGNAGVSGGGGTMRETGAFIVVD